MDQYFGKYQVISVIGKGAMGVVYLGFDKTLERQVAIKTIAPTKCDEEVRSRFIREAKSTAKLHHNNIVTIYDFGSEKDDLYIVMEYIEGRNLEEIIANKDELDIVERLEIVRQICLGLEYAHAKGIFHRDIKPANIRLLKDGTVKIVDFGLAAMHTSTLTKTGAVMGTPHYIAPERLKATRCNGRADQFSVGLLFYELLTYIRPFTGESISSIIFKILNSEPMTLDKAILAKFPELETIIKKAIAKDQEHRYPTMTSMADDIEALQKKISDTGFSLTGSVKISDVPMQSEVDDMMPATTNLELASSPPKRKFPKFVAAAVWFFSIMTLVAVLYLLVIKGKTPNSAFSPGQTDVGFLAFDVKPFASIQKVVLLGQSESIELPKASRTTPIRLALKPGIYTIFYSIPSSTEPNRKRTVHIHKGVTVFEKDSRDLKFIEEAILHFSINL
jgi:serine/threonine protein kinase